jgi:hypothetical protein
MSWRGLVPYEDGAEIARYEFWWLPIRPDEHREPDVQMFFDVTLGVALGQDSSAPGRDVVPVLREIATEVERILNQFKPLQRSS